MASLLPPDFCAEQNWPSETSLAEALDLCHLAQINLGLDPESGVLFAQSQGSHDDSDAEPDIED